MELVPVALIVLVLFVVILALSDWIGGSRFGGLADYILGSTEPFAEPTADDEPRPLRLVMYGEPKLGETRFGLPDVVILDMPKLTLQARRQRHRDAFCRNILSIRGHVPHPAQCDRWWPGTRMTKPERDYEMR